MQAREMLHALRDAAAQGTQGPFTAMPDDENNSYVQGDVYWGVYNVNEDCLVNAISQHDALLIATLLNGLPARLDKVDAWLHEADDLAETGYKDDAAKAHLLRRCAHDALIDDWQAMQRAKESQHA